MRRSFVSTAAAALLVAACGGLDPAGTGAAAPVALETPAPGTAAPVTEPAGPVYGLRDDTVVIVDASSGAVTRTIPVGGGELVDLALVSVRGTVVVSRRAPDGHDELVEVVLDTGATEVLAEGSDPVVTPGGEELAYVHELEGGQREVVVRTYGGVVLGRWPLAEEGQRDLGLDLLGWNAAGRLVALLVRTPEGNELLLLDTEVAGTVRSASDEVAPTSVGATWVTGRFRQPEVLTLVEACCRAEGYERFRVVDLTREVHAVSELLVLDRPVRAVDWNHDLQHLLLVTGPVPVGTAGDPLDGPPAVLRWHAGEPQEIITGLTDADW